MNGQTIVFIGVAAGIIAMPGADFAIVVRNALRDRRSGLATAIGVVGGLLLHTSLAAFGLAAVLTAFPIAYATLRWIGALYLLYLGIRVFVEVRRPAGHTPARASDAGRRASDDTQTPGSGPAGVSRRRLLVAQRAAATSRGRVETATVRRAFRQGFLTNATNPKAPVLFLSLLPQFIPAGVAVLPRTLLLCSLIVLLGLLWFPLIALIVDRAGAVLRRPGTATVINVITGAALVTLGVFMVVESIG